MANLNKSVLGFLSLVLAISQLGEALGQGDTSEAPRKLAPGVITVIRDANIDDSTLDDAREFSELLSIAKPPEWTPNFDPTTETLLDKAKRTSFQREVWSLEFGFKPLRVIKVGGRDIWYLIYYVRNTGEARTATTTTNTSIEITGRKKAVRFVPSFVLQAHDLNQSYGDKILPEVVQQIASKERVTRGRLHDGASIRKVQIPVSTATADRRVWGVATWDEVDPRADLISTYVFGLTNAYQWQAPTGGYKKGMDLTEQDVVKSKALQLNFWRAGDNVGLNDDEFQFGLPHYPDQPARDQAVLRYYKLDKPVRHRWVYR